MRESGSLLGVNRDLLQALYSESRVQLPGHPLHNKYINYYNHWEDDYMKRPRDTTPIYTPSRWYEFRYMREDVQGDIQYTEQDADQPECGIDIFQPHEAVTKSLLTKCHNISRHQPVTDLCLSVHCRDLPAVEAPIMSRNAQSLRFAFCILTVGFMKSILCQLIISRCVTLQMLRLEWIDFSLVEGHFSGLGAVEEELDELMEQLVSHHEAGTAQEKLNVMLKEEVTKRYLSGEFMAKWSRRCQGITSIEYDIPTHSNIVRPIPNVQLELFCESVTSKEYSRETEPIQEPLKRIVENEVEVKEMISPGSRLSTLKHLAKGKQKQLLHS